MRKRIILAAAFGAALAAPAFGQDGTTAIRTSITNDLPDNMEGEISPLDLRGILLAMLNEIDTRPDLDAVDARISPFARVPPVGTVPLASIPNLPGSRITSGLIAGARIGTNPAVGRFLTYPSAWRVIADADIPSSIARSVEVPPDPATWARFTSPVGVAPANRLGANPAAGEFLAASSATVTAWRGIADADLPASIARDTELPVAPATWARGTGATGTAPFARLPFPDCLSGQILERGASAWACGTDDTATGGSGLDAAGVRDQVNTMLLTGTNIGLTRTGSGASRTIAIGLTGTLGFGNLPFTDCASGSLLYRGASAWGCETSATRNTVIDSRISPAARATPTGTFAAAQIPNLSTGKITSGIFFAARLAAAPANGRFLRAISSTVTSWGTIAAADVPDLPASRIASGTLADARIPAAVARDAEIETWAIQASTGAAAIVPATVIDNALTRDAEIPAALFAGAAGWSRAAAGECLRVVAGTTTATRTSFDWEPCPSGGGGGATVAYLSDALDADLAVDTPETDDTWSAWNDVATLSAITNDVGRSLLICHVDGIASHTPGADNANSGGDRLMTEVRIVEGTGANPDVIDVNRVYGPRFGTNFGGTNFIAATSRLTTDTVAVDLTEAGDVYRCQVRIIAQSTHQRRMTFQANATLLELYQVR